MKNIQGNLILEEQHYGVISYVSDSSIAVRYGSGDAEFEIEYPLSHFAEGTKLNRGDKIEAVIVLLSVPRPPVSLNDLYTDKELEKLDADWEKSGTIGPIEL